LLIAVCIASAIGAGESAADKLGSPLYLWSFDEAQGPAMSSHGGAAGQFGRSAYRVHGLIGTGAVELGAKDFYDPESHVDFGVNAAHFGTRDFTVVHWYRTRFAELGHHGDVLGNREAPSHGNFLSIRVRGDGRLTFEVDQDESG